MSLQKTNLINLLIPKLKQLSKLKWIKANKLQ